MTVKRERRTFAVCIDPDIEDVIVKAEVVFYVQDTGWLTFRENDGAPVAAFPPGWRYFNVMEEV